MTSTTNIWPNLKPIIHDPIKRHGGPYDRGSADRYYGRAYNPHYYLGNSITSMRVGKDGMTQQEISQYTAGFKDQWDSKDWGSDIDATDIEDAAAADTSADDSDAE